MIRKFSTLFKAASVFLASMALIAGTASCAITGAAINAAGATGLISGEAADALSRMNDAASTAAQDITPSEEYYIGRAVAANILSNYKLYTADPALTQYVNEILDTLVINSPRPDIYNGYHAAILDTDEINGFSTSGGHVFITRGLIACAANEDGLASVIAHELAHIQLQHSVKSIKNSRFNDALQQIAGIAAKAIGLDELTQIFDESIKEAVNTALNNGYSKEQEYEADATAMALLASAGYTPSSIVGMLESIKSHSGGKDSYPSLSKAVKSTHPTPDDRLAEVQKGLAAYATLPDNSAARKPRFAAVVK
jgi:predicted Zn-dependent protease